MSCKGRSSFTSNAIVVKHAIGCSTNKHFIHSGFLRRLEFFFFCPFLGPDSTTYHSNAHIFVVLELGTSTLAPLFPPTATTLLPYQGLTFQVPRHRTNTTLFSLFPMRGRLSYRAETLRSQGGPCSYHDQCSKIKGHPIRSHPSQWPPGCSRSITLQKKEGGARLPINQSSPKPSKTSDRLYQPFSRAAIQGPSHNMVGGSNSEDSRGLDDAQ